MLRIRRGVLRVVNSGCSNISVGLLRIPIYGKSFMYVEPRCSTFNGFSHFHTTSIISAGDKGNGSSHSKSNPPQMIRPSAKNSLDIAASVRSAVVLARNAVLAVPGLLKSFGEMAFRAAMNPKATWASIKEEIHHYWLGTKLLWEDVKTASQILQRVVVGHGITRRERLQLVRTTTDIFRLVPFSIFIIVPFMELLLPFALRLFPNMLPSTFQDSLRKEESLKKELQVRLEVAKFMQETLQEMAEKKSSSIDRQNSGAKEVRFLLC